MAEQDIHATGKANRRRTTEPDGHGTAKASRNRPVEPDVHGTGKANRQGKPEPFRTGDAHRARNIQNRQAQAAVSEWPDEFKLNGVIYKNEGVLSDSSGEAIIFTVSRRGKKYALKIYYYDPDHRPNHTILEKISRMADSGLLVNLVAHGQWDNPNGESNDFELMDFCEGGSMDNVVLQGDEKKLAEVAVRMASAIDFLAKHGILHRDIKPANFFYADAAKTQIVLGDFGISVACPQGETVKIDEMRSPVYAAPEFYVNVPGEPAEVGVASDYFSLGVSLLCLWTGKAQFTANENQLLKQKMSETLPIPKDMSAHMASLIKALTRIKVSERADFDAIKRWVKGETLDSESAATDSTNFRVVFNSAKNQIAHSQAELAHYLLDDKALGKKYLYSGRVTRWLEETGANEVAVNVEEIVEKVYPRNQEAGLMSVYYMLDPAADYIAPNGKHFTDPKEISMHIYRQDLVNELLDKDSNLMIYLKALKMDNLIANLRGFIDKLEKSNYSNYLICYYFALLLNSGLPLPLMIGDKTEQVQNVAELLKVLSKEGPKLGAFNQTLIRSEVLIVWLAARDAALAGKIRMLHDKSNNDPESPYYHSWYASRIIYELDPRADLMLNTDPDSPNHIYSVEQVGGFLNSQLNLMVEGKQPYDTFKNMFEDMTNNFIGHYLRARGENYMNFLSWSRFCMEVYNNDNGQKAGPYDEVIGAYKTVAGFLGHGPTYPLGGKLIASPDELDDFSKEDVEAAIDGPIHKMPEKGKKMRWLDAWLAVFYQEDPQLDLSEQFTYEKTTAEYVELLCAYAPDNYYVDRYYEALATVDVAAKQIQKDRRKLRLKQWAYILLCGLPSLAMIFGGLIFGTSETNPIYNHFWASAGIFFVFGMVLLFRDLGFTLTLIPACGSAIIGSGLLWAGFKWWPEATPILVAVILALMAVVFLIAIFKTNKVDTGGKIIRGDEFEYRQLDALHYAYKELDDELENVVTEYAQLEDNNYDLNSQETGKTGRLWAFAVLPLFVIWCFITPQITGSHSWVTENQRVEAMKGQWALGTWDAHYKDGTTRIIANIDSVAPNGEEIFGTMIIAGQAPMKAHGNVKSKNDTLPDTFLFWPIEGGDREKRSMQGIYLRTKKEMTGNYFDRHRKVHKLEFTKIPLPVNEDETVQ